MTDRFGNYQWASSSFNNSMVADTIQEGLETTDNSYGVTHANPETFIYNKWRTLGGTWYFETDAGDGGHSDKPPYWTWIAQPSPGNNGGTGQTTCC
jgi:hypothetical protein